MEETKGAERKSSRSGVFAGLTAACFACVLTVVGGDLSSELAHKSLLLLCPAIVVLTGFLFMDMVPGEFHVSILMKVLSALGLLLAVLGLAMFVYSYSPPAGVLSVVLSFGMMGIINAAETRAKKRKKKAEREAVKK